MAMPPQLKAALAMKNAKGGSKDKAPFSQADVAEDKKAGVKPSAAEDRAEMIAAMKKKMQGAAARRMMGK